MIKQTQQNFNSCEYRQRRTHTVVPANIQIKVQKLTEKFNRAKAKEYSGIQKGRAKSIRLKESQILSTTSDPNTQPDIFITG